MSDLPGAVLFDFSGTLFHVENAAAALSSALGVEFVELAASLERWGAINGSGTPARLPAHLADVWQRRDLSAAAHRAAYSGLGEHAGLSPDQAHSVYERGLTAAAWQPFPDTVATLHRLASDGVPTALVSNIGWDPRVVLQAHGADGYLRHLVLSDEVAVQKPDPEIFRIACTLLAVDPHDALMVGDNVEADGGATAIGCRFALVSGSASRPPDTLLRAVGYGHSSPS